MSEESRIVFVDPEVNPETGKVREYGAFSPEGGQYRGASAAAFSRVLTGAGYVCGHNLLRHGLHPVYFAGIPALGNH